MVKAILKTGLVASGVAAVAAAKILTKGKSKIMARKTTQQTQTKTSEKPRTTDTGRTESFSLRAPDAKKVQLVGDFTQWQERPINLQKSADGNWSATVILPPGTHQYKFVVDGNWCDDPDCKQRSPNPFGGHNMMRRVA